MFEVLGRGKLSSFGFFLKWLISGVVLSLCLNRSFYILGLITVGVVLFFVVGPSLVNLVFNIFDHSSVRMVLLVLFLWIIIFSLVKNKTFLSFQNSLVLLRTSLFFMSSSWFLFFLFFELRLIPILLIVFGWGYQYERLQASYYLLLFSMVFGFSFILRVVVLQDQLCRGFMFLNPYRVRREVLWWIFRLAFLVKLPIFFLHRWLPKAHVEAPTLGSILLAGVLLKLGGFGLIRLSMYFNESQVIVFVFVRLGGILSVISCLFQSDLKRAIAFSSISHMNIIVLGNLLINKRAGCLMNLIILLHGIISASLFFLMGIQYQLKLSRIVYFFQRLSLTRGSILLFLWCLFLRANFGVPPLLSRIGEIVLFGVIFCNIKVFGIMLLLYALLACYFSLFLRALVFSGKIRKSWVEEVFFRGGTIRFRGFLLFRYSLLRVLI